MVILAEDQILQHERMEDLIHHIVEIVGNVIG